MGWESFLYKVGRTPRFLAFKHIPKLVAGFRLMARALEMSERLNEYYDTVDHDITDDDTVAYAERQDKIASETYLDAINFLEDLRAEANRGKVVYIVKVKPNEGTEGEADVLGVDKDDWEAVDRVREYINGGGDIENRTLVIEEWTLNVRNDVPRLVRRSKIQQLIDDRKTLVPF